MSINRRRFLSAGSLGVVGAALPAGLPKSIAQAIGAPLPSGTGSHPLRAPDFIMPSFAPVQPELFASPGAQTNCWADFDADGDLDLFVGFKGGFKNRLYRNDGGSFAEIGDQAGISDLADTRGTAWGDFDADGYPDLFVGFSRKSAAMAKLYRNQGNGRFVDVARDLGIQVYGESRQISWIDFDNDGKLDLFVALRDAPNMLFHNEGNRFVDVAKDMRVDDPRKTVGAVWFDFNQDGRLDVFTANQDGTSDGLYRNDGNTFVDVAHELGMDQSGRPVDQGSCGPSVIDYDNDGLLDLFVAGYGANFLYHNEGNGNFRNVARELGVFGGDEATPSNWGDYDNDGRPDLYVSSYVSHPLNEHDHMYHNAGSHLSEVISPVMLANGATHGIQWADYDGDGALDLAVCNNNPKGHHYLWRNQLPPERARRSIQVMVVDVRGKATKAGAEVRIYAAGTRQLLGTRLVDTGSGYCSQSILPVHFGLSSEEKVDVEVTSMTKAGRKVTRVTSVDHDQLPRRILTVKVI